MQFCLYGSVFLDNNFEIFLDLNQNINLKILNLIITQSSIVTSILEQLNLIF